MFKGVEMDHHLRLKNISLSVEVWFCNNKSWMWWYYSLKWKMGESNKDLTKR